MSSGPPSPCPTYMRRSRSTKAIWGSSPSSQAPAPTSPTAAVSTVRVAGPLNVYQSDTAGKTRATLATWYVDDIDQIVDELTSSGVELVRYDQFEHDSKGITPRAGGGRIAWFQDPDGNTFALEADV